MFEFLKRVKREEVKNGDIDKNILPIEIKIEEEPLKVEEEVLPEEELLEVEEEVLPEEEPLKVEEEVLPEEEPLKVEEEVLPEEEPLKVEEEILPEEKPLKVEQEPIQEMSIEPTKFSIKEDANIMSIPCDHKNYLPQSILQIDKKLITDPDDVGIVVNLAHLNSLDSLEEGFTQIIDIPDPCGGPGTIQGEALLEKVIIVGGVHYSILLFDKSTASKVYDGDVEFVTAYTLYKIMPFEVEVDVDPAKVTANFTTTLTKLPDIPGVDFYLYTVDGEVELVYNP